MSDQKENTSTILTKSEVEELHHLNIIVPDDDRITDDKITLFEKTRVIEERAKQIENGSMIFIDIGDESDPIKIAEMEIAQRKCPLSVRRRIQKNIVEVWSVNELIHK